MNPFKPGDVISLIEETKSGFLTSDTNKAIYNACFKHNRVVVKAVYSNRIYLITLELGLSLILEEEFVYFTPVPNIATLDDLEDRFIEWHHEVGLVEGATDKSQCTKMIEEVIELYCACNPDTPSELLHFSFTKQVNKLARDGKFKTVSLADSKAEKIDAVGDLNVVGTNILIRNNVSKLSAMQGVYEILSKRVGHGKMVNGTFVKDKE